MESFRSIRICLGRLGGQGFFGQTLATSRQPEQIRACEVISEPGSIVLCSEWQLGAALARPCLQPKWRPKKPRVGRQ